GRVVLCADDEVTARLAAARPGVRTYGTAPRAHYRIVDEVSEARGCRFALEVDGARAGELAVPLGVKVATNAAGAAAVALELGVPFDAVARALAGFGGVARRFQFRGERDG